VSTRLPSGAASAGLLAAAVGLFVMSTLTGLESCAHVAAPPGGPADTIPPQLIAVQPDSFAVVPGFDDDVKFEFDESLSERGIEGSTTLYPFEPRPRVKKGGRELRVRPREGWVDDRIYHIRVGPVIADLFQNTIEKPIEYVISTGPPIPPNRLEGTVYDRITAKPLPGGRVDMVRLPDTLRYGGVADSVGTYELGMLPVGEYLAIGYEDVNGNREADDFDRSDTVNVSLADADTLTVDFQVFHHDTVGPNLVDVEAIDTLIVELTFDGYLDPETPLSTANFQIFALDDSTPIPLDTVLHAWQYTAWRDSIQAARRAAAAAAAAAADTLGVEPDTLVGAPDTAEAGAPPQIEEPADTVPREEGQGEGEDEGEEPTVLPDQRVYVVAARRIPPGAHVVRFSAVLNLDQLAGEGEAEFEPVEPPPEAPSEEEQPPPDPPPGRDR
jgi:hypothetical protein